MMTSQFPFDDERHRERGTKAYINSNHIKQNLKTFKNLHKGKVIAVVKADAYGHGLSRVVTALKHADAFAVATIEEAQLLRALDSDKRIILLEGVFNDDELNQALEYKFDVVIHQDYQIELLKNTSCDSRIDVWLKIDTGMSRLGFAVKSYDSKLVQLETLDAVNVIRLMTHYAESGDVDSAQTKSQYRFNHTIIDQGYEYSFSNTAAVLNELAFEDEWVRVGIGLYGISPLKNPKWSQYFELKPAMQLTAKIIATKYISKGTKVGYCGRFVAAEEMRIGIVGIGYADGYPWSELTSSVLVDGKKVAVLGRVSMDMIAIDISQFDQAMTGLEVTMWGGDLPIELVANDLKLIPYALTCGITSRVKFYDIQ